MFKGVLKESVLLEISNNYINEAVHVLSEEDDSRTFTWDIAKEKIDKSKEHINSKSQAEEYLEGFFDKIKSLPRKSKVKLTKYVIASFIGLISYANMSSIISNGAPELKKDLSLSSMNMDFTGGQESEEEREEEHKEEYEEKSVEQIYQNPTEASDVLINLIKKAEGQAKHKGEPVLSAYALGDGKITVGWGHAESVSKSKFSVGQKISRAKAESLLASDIQYAKEGIDRLLVRWEKQGINPEIDQHMYDAMISMVFNMGVQGFLNTDFIQLVKRSKFKEAKEKILTTNVTWDGHIPRRKEESELFGKNISESIISESCKVRLRNLAGIL